MFFSRTAICLAAAMPLSFRRFAALLLIAGPLFAATAPSLRVSENHRFLQRSDGRPFFWLADTDWELFHRASREDATLLLEDRAKKGFTVIQAVVLAEEDGLHD